VHGAEVKIEIPPGRPLSGSLSYTWMKGEAELPVTGGLFLGDEVDLGEAGERIPISQDQRHTLRGRVAAQLTPAAWVALATTFDSGLPFEDEGAAEGVDDDIPQNILDQVNFETGRVRPAWTFDLSAGLFVGWLRALVALFLAQTGYAVSTALELSFFAQDLQRLSSAPADAGAPLLVGLFFMAAGLAITVIAVLAAGGLLRFALARRGSAPATAPPVTEPSPAARSPWSAPEVRLASSASRVQRVIDAVGASAAVTERPLGWEPRARDRKTRTRPSQRG